MSSIHDEPASRSDAVGLFLTVRKELGHAGGTTLATHGLAPALVRRRAAGGEEIGGPDARDARVVGGDGMLHGRVFGIMAKVPLNGNAVATAIGIDRVHLIVDALLPGAQDEARGPERRERVLRQTGCRERNGRGIIVAAAHAVCVLRARVQHERRVCEPEVRRHVQTRVELVEDAPSDAVLCQQV